MQLLKNIDQNQHKTKKSVIGYIVYRWLKQYYVIYFVHAVSQQCHL